LAASIGEPTHAGRATGLWRRPPYPLQQAVLDARVSLVVLPDEVELSLRDDLGIAEAL